MVTPLLLETLVDVTRFNGTCYRAANWIALGQTTGRGRMDRHHIALGTLKRIFVLPLHRRVQQRLCATVPPRSHSRMPTNAVNGTSDGFGSTIFYGSSAFWSVML